MMRFVMLAAFGTFVGWMIWLSPSPPKCEEYAIEACDEMVCVSQWSNGCYRYVHKTQCTVCTKWSQP